MNYNDVLRRLRYALDLGDHSMIEAFSLGGYDMRPLALVAVLRQEDAPGYEECPPAAMKAFLDGFIEQRRGKPDRKVQAPSGGRTVNNNDIMKALRIALQLRDEDIVDILKLSDMVVSKSELGAIFRKPGHENYKPCMDQFLRNFLMGLTKRERG